MATYRITQWRCAAHPATIVMTDAQFNAHPASDTKTIADAYANGARCKGAAVTAAGAHKGGSDKLRGFYRDEPPRMCIWHR